jgi:hypothetical protein
VCSSSSWALLSPADCNAASCHTAMCCLDCTCCDLTASTPSTSGPASATGTCVSPTPAPLCPSPSAQMGTVATLSPVRATGNMRGFLGGMGMGRAITPVRRSTRKMAAGPHRPLEAMLEEADFSYGALRVWQRPHGPGTMAAPPCVCV